MSYGAPVTAVLIMIWAASRGQPAAATTGGPVQDVTVRLKVDDPPVDCGLALTL
jgi:hypothetical protein